MKKKHVIWITVLGVLVAIPLALQIVVNLKLAPLIRQELEKSGTAPFEQTTFDSIRFNLFTGRLHARGVSVPNPGVLSQPHMFAAPFFSARVSYGSLLRGIIKISDVRISELAISVIRQSDGSWNLPWFPAPDDVEVPGAPSEKRPEPQDPQDTAPDASPAATPSFDPGAPAELELPPLLSKRQLHIVDASVPIRITYADQLAAPDGPPLQVLATLRVEDLFTYGYLPEDQWGTITLTGGNPDAPDTFAIDLKARIAPLLEPELASFSLQGSLSSFDMNQIAPWQEATGVLTDSMDLHANLATRDGQFLPGAHMQIRARNAKATENASADLRKIEWPPVVNLQLPVSGTLEDPAVNLAQAITQTILQTLSENPEYLLDQIRIDGKSLRQRLRF